MCKATVAITLPPPIRSAALCEDQKTVTHAALILLLTQSVALITKIARRGGIRPGHRVAHRRSRSLIRCRRDANACV